MKILFIVGSLTSGGKERQLIETLKGLEKFKFIKSELIILTNIIHYKEVNKLDIRLHILERIIKKDPFVFWQIQKICKRFAPDIINSWDSMSSVYAVPIAKINKIKFINSMIQNAPIKLECKVYILSRLTFHFSDVILANSYAGLKSYKTPINKSYVIYNGFDFNRIENLHDSKTVKAKFDIKTDIVIGMVASFSKKKDYKTYIKAANLVLKKNNNITFLCIGAGDDSFYRKLVNSENREKIKFLGRQEDVESIMNICDIGVLTTYTEGISNSIMEFMALGKPVIATDGDGTKELIIDGETGFLIKQKNYVQLVDKIEYLLDNKKEAAFMGSKGRERIKQEFSLEKMTNSFVSLYKGAINH